MVLGKKRRYWWLGLAMMSGDLDRLTPSQLAAAISAMITEPHVRHWLDMAIRIEGTNKTFGVHAAGVVISSQPLDEVVPSRKIMMGR